MSDKLTEIMAWKRREIAPLLRPVTVGELALLDSKLPLSPSFAAALITSHCANTCADVSSLPVPKTCG